jgi:hypothetical protein
MNRHVLETILEGKVGRETRNTNMSSENTYYASPKNGIAPSPGNSQFPSDFEHHNHHNFNTSKKAEF